MEETLITIFPPAVVVAWTAIQAVVNGIAKEIIAEGEIIDPDPNWQYIFSDLVVDNTCLEPLDNDVKFADDNSAYGDKSVLIAFWTQVVVGIVVPTVGYAGTVADIEGTCENVVVVSASIVFIFKDVIYI